MLWMAAVTYACLAPFDDLDDPGFELPHADKIAHFTFYLIAAVLGVLALRERAGRRVGLNGALWLAAVVLTAYGGVIEALQAVSPTGRSPEWGDFLANSLGLLAAVASLKVAFHELGALNWPD